MRALVHPFFDADTCSYTYVVVEPATRACAIIDPVLNYDPQTGASSRAADRLADFVMANGLVVEWLLETHVHADHLSAARYLKDRFRAAQIGISANVSKVQRAFANALNRPIAVDGSQFDRLFMDGERIRLGHLTGRVVATPGHTPACVTYVFDDAAFVGDTLFMPDFGTARCDFPGGDAGVLYDSVQRVLALPGPTRLFMCHDYAPGGRPYRCCTTVESERCDNVHISDATDRDAFTQLRESRDANLDVPGLMTVAVPYNLASGQCVAGELRCELDALAA